MAKVSRKQVKLRGGVVGDFWKAGRVIRSSCSESRGAGLETKTNVEGQEIVGCAATQERSVDGEGRVRG